MTDDEVLNIMITDSLDAAPCSVIPNKLHGITTQKKI